MGILEPAGRSHRQDRKLKLRSLDGLDVAGRRVFLRVDLNVPIQHGRIQDDLRIRASLPTIRYLLDRGAKVICSSHLGRPKGKVDPSLSMVPIGQALADLIERRVRVTGDPNGPAEDLEGMEADEVALLENLRFDVREEANEPSFAKELAELADCYVGDAFGAVHRAHASVASLPYLLPSAAGLLLQKEVEVLSSLLESPRSPVVVVLGGAKVSDKIGVIRNLARIADTILIGGAMANTFLKAEGMGVGSSRVESERIAEVAESLRMVRELGTRVSLPLDVVTAPAFERDSPPSISDVGAIADDEMALDIGPRTRELFTEVIDGAATVLWNGPMGVFEWEPFSAGTRTVAEAVARTEAYTVVGGGDSAAALSLFGLYDRVDHVSTGGGASLEFLEGRVLPGLVPLLEGDR